jgi:DNA-binding MarR family transcriptional regulator
MAKIVFMALTTTAKTTIMAMTKMPKLPHAELRYEAQLAQILRDSGWEVLRHPEVPREIDLLIRRDNSAYAVEVKRAAESRRDRIVPLLAEAILQAQAHAHVIPQARPLAVIASPHLSPSVVDQALEFQKAYAPAVAVGFFDDGGFRRFRGPGLELLNSPPREIGRQKSMFAEPQSYPLFSDLGQWMLKVILAQHIEPQFLNAPRQRIHNASELALAAGVSQVSASRLVRKLEAEGFLDQHGNEVKLVRIDDLLDEWQAAVRRAYKEIPRRWVIPGHSGKQFESALRAYLARQINQSPPEISADSDSPRVCQGLFAAADALGLGFVRGVPPVLYVERFDAEMMEQFGISHESAERADLYLRVPIHKESVFRAAVDHDGLPVSDALQVWLDVSNHPSRGKEQADRLRERILSPILRQ